MAIRVDQLNEKIGRLMSPRDQQFYGLAPQLPELKRERKTDNLERTEQGTFANDCLRKGYAYVWHSTAHKTKATLGCPDFIVVVNGVTLWIEFKREGGRLSSDQQEFKARLERNGGFYSIVYSAAEAIALTSKYE